eukprot:6049938-Amphidinium_carterae.1
MAVPWVRDVPFGNPSDPNQASKYGCKQQDWKLPGHASHHLGHSDGERYQSAPVAPWQEQFASLFPDMQQALTHNESHGHFFRVFVTAVPVLTGKGFAPKVDKMQNSIKQPMSMERQPKRSNTTAIGPAPSAAKTSIYAQLKPDALTSGFVQSWSREIRGSTLAMRVRLF